jgi:hypothetical protein
MDLRLLGCLVRCTDARELLDLARLRFLIQTLGISLLCNVDGHVDEDFDEWERAVSVLGVGVQFAGDLAVGFIWGDEGGERDCGRVGEEFGDLN